jgi:MAF protein
VAAAPVDERQGTGEAPEALVRRLSRAKAAAVAQQYPEAVIIGADTVVVLDGVVLGKPADEADAVLMLCALRGRAHIVFSALSALDAKSLDAVTVLSESRVWMRDYGDAEMERYIATGDPLDKAGAYAIQHAIFAPVSRIEGCYTGVMGLPLGHLERLLDRMGVAVPVDVAQACELATGTVCCLRGA